MFLKVAFWRRQSGFFGAPIVALFVNIFSPLFISIISTIACIICSSTFVACICSRFLLRGVEDWTNWNKCSVTYDDTDISPKTNQHMIFLATFSFDNVAAEFFEMLETTSNLAHQNTDFISNYRSFGKLEQMSSHKKTLHWNSKFLIWKKKLHWKKWIRNWYYIKEFTI